MTAGFGENLAGRDRSPQVSAPSVIVRPLSVVMGTKKKMSISQDIFFILLQNKKKVQKNENKILFCSDGKKRGTHLGAKNETIMNYWDKGLETDQVD